MDIRQRDKEAQEKMAAYLAATSRPTTADKKSSSRLVQSEMPQLPQFHRSPTTISHQGLVEDLASPKGQASIPSPPPSPLGTFKGGAISQNGNHLAPGKPRSRTPSPINPQAANETAFNGSRSPSPRSFVSATSTRSNSPYLNGRASPSSPNFTTPIADPEREPPIPNHLGDHPNHLGDHPNHLGDLQPKLNKISPAPWDADAPAPPSPSTKRPTTSASSRSRSKSFGRKADAPMLPPPGTMPTSNTRHRSSTSQDQSPPNTSFGPGEYLSPKVHHENGKTKKLLGLFSRGPKRYQHGGVSSENLHEALVEPIIPSSLPTLEINGPSIAATLPTGFFNQQERDDLLSSLAQGEDKPRTYTNQELYRILKNMQKAYQVMVFELHSQIGELKAEVDRLKEESSQPSVTEYARANGFSRGKN